MLDIFANWMQRGWLPDFAIRWGVRRVCPMRLRELRGSGISAAQETLRFAEELKRSPVAIKTKGLVRAFEHKG